MHLDLRKLFRSKKRSSEDSDTQPQSKLDAGLLRIQEQMEGDIKNRSAASVFFRRALIRGGIFLSIMLFFLMGLFEYSPGILQPSQDTPRSFIMESCVLSEGLKCSLKLSSYMSFFKLESENVILKDVEFSSCSNHTDIINNTATLYNCSFSPISNSRKIKITVIRPDAAFERKINGRVVRLLEITKIRVLLSRIIKR